MTHLLLIDDDAELCAMLTEYLSEAGFKTSTTLTGEDGLRVLSGGTFEAVILDIMLPGIDGVEVLQRIRNVSAIPVIMLTAKGHDVVDRAVGLELGADDYIAKPYSPRELVARLRAVLRRQPEIRTVGTEYHRKDLSLDHASRRVRWQGLPFILTASEFDMLEAMLMAGDKVCTKDDLSRTVLGRKRAIYDRSIDVHVSNLRRKLAAASGGQIQVETVRGIGYRLRFL